MSPKGDLFFLFHVRQFQEFLTKRSVTSQGLPVSMTLFAVPRTEVAASLSENGTERSHIPDHNGRVKHGFGAPCCHHVIAERIPPTTAVEKFLVETFKDLQPFCRAETRPTGIAKDCLLQLADLRDVRALAIEPAAESVGSVQDFIQRREADHADA